MGDTPAKVKKQSAVAKASSKFNGDSITTAVLYPAHSSQRKESTPLERTRIGNYYLRCHVGRGGFADIYMGEHIHLHTLAAIKLLHARLTQKDAEGFIKEAQTLAHLVHRHIVHVLDFDVEDEIPFLVMDYAPNGSLRNRHSKGERVPLSLVISYVKQIGDALQYAHNRNLIHLDMKPENILIMQNGETVLTDFGIATIADNTSSMKVFQTTVGTLILRSALGTIPYTAPEQILGKPTVASDQYALGVAVYEWLCGEQPFNGRDVDIMTSHLTQRPPSLHSHNPAILPEIEHVVLKALEKDPEQRYKSVQEFADEFEWVSRRRGGSWFQPLDPTIPVRLGQQVATTPSNLAIGNSPATSPQLTRPTVSQHEQGYRLSRRRVFALSAASIAGVAAAATGIDWYLSRGQGGNPKKKVDSLVGGTIAVNFLYSTEKDNWIKAAVDAFHNSRMARLKGQTIQVQLTPLGSVEGLDQILSGAIRPIIWSPASSLELNLLRTKWQQSNQGKDILSDAADLEPRSLVYSPLVFAIWKDRADVLLQHYGSIDLPIIHDALTQPDWAEIGGDSGWGHVKFGHTRPDRSNSGLLTITLLAYAYFQEQIGLTIAQVRAPKFLAYLDDFERAVYAFGVSSGTFINNVVISPQYRNYYDVTTTYESLLLNLQGQPLQMFYPSLNMSSDHPFAILQGNWVKPEELEAALIFRDFLLDVPQQQLALASGFRPTNPKVQITDKIANNAFLRPISGTTIQPQIQPLAATPGGAVLDEEKRLWRIHYNDKLTITG